MATVYVVKEAGCENIPKYASATFATLSVIQNSAKKGDVVVRRKQFTDSGTRRNQWAVIPVRPWTQTPYAKPLGFYRTVNRAIEVALDRARKSEKHPAPAAEPAPAALTATVTLTLAEIEILRRVLAPELGYWEYAAQQPFRDAKERDRVLDYQHKTRALAEKIGRANRDATPAV